MIDELTGTNEDDFEEETKPTTKVAKSSAKIFSRSDVVRSVKVNLTLPNLYPGYDPWEFDLRLTFTKDAEDRRQEYLSLTPTEMTVREREQNLDELCDLLVSTPKGFADLKDDGKGPGSSFKTYVMTADPETQDILFTIVRGAIAFYWRKISPQEFRGAV